MVYSQGDKKRVLFKAKVNPSQRTSDHVHEVYGPIVSAHCTCMAGLFKCPFVPAYMDYYMYMI